MNNQIKTYWTQLGICATLLLPTVCLASNSSMLPVNTSTAPSQTRTDAKTLFRRVFNLSSYFEGSVNANKRNKTEIKDCISQLKDLADKGNVDAQSSLGSIYIHAIGVPINNAKGAMWFRKAAEQGNARALYWLSNLYKYGDGVERDTDKALRLLEQAAFLGDESAIKTMEELSEDEDQGPVLIRTRA